MFCRAYMSKRFEPETIDLHGHARERKVQN